MAFHDVYRYKMLRGRGVIVQAGTDGTAVLNGGKRKEIAGWKR